MVALALAPGAAVAYLAVIPVGITSVMVISGSNAVVQLGTDPAMRGRVLALLAVVFLGSTPIGGPISGWVSETFGARWALGVGAVTALLAGALTLRALRSLPAGRRRRRRSSSIRRRSSWPRAADAQRRLSLQVCPCSTSVSCGRPETRSATMLRCTSPVPPPTVSAGENRKP